MNKYVKKEIEFAGKKLTLETGQLAVQANMAVKATYGDTVVLVTTVAGPANPDIDFFPLTVVYEEKLYASGSIKSSRFVKRDGRPTDEAIVTKRLVDHAIRPLFPRDYMDEVQVVATILSLDPEADPTFVSMIATSACLTASDVAWEGPMVSARVGYINNEYILNPSSHEIEEETELDMMVSFVGDERRFLAIEAEVAVLPEEKVLGAIEFARNELEPLVGFIQDFAKDVNPENVKYAYTSKAVTDEIFNAVKEIAQPKIVEMLSQGFDKTKMKDASEELLNEIYAKFEGTYKKVDMELAFTKVEKYAVQHLILEEGKRPDGRGIKDIRDISVEVGVLPRTHGSGLFTRGLTQVLTVATLGSPSNEMLIQDMYGETAKRFMHFYNFPPYSVGETGRMSGPGGREIGHGMLAERALRPVIPSQQEFPYTIVLMSETLSSNGSSSMAATCGSTLALMDAGVPIKAMVAGVGVGLIVNDDLSEHKLLTDLAGIEDQYGFLDFKMTGTRTGITAIQADMKAFGIPFELVPLIFEQSHEGRMHVLDEMEKIIKESRTEVSKYAPKTYSTKIDPDKIGMIIGTGGKVIKELQEKTKSEISIEEDGTVVVSAINEEGARRAVEIINGMVKEVEPGEVYDGVVEELAEFGAFVEILPGKTGLLHISEIANGYVTKVDDFLKVGDTVKVKVLEAGRDGKISLSKRALEPGYEPKENSGRPRNGNRDRGRGQRRY